MEQIFRTILHMNLTASVVIAVVLFLRLLLRRAPKIFSYILWIAVLFRLICPVAAESTFGLPIMRGNSWQMAWEQIQDPKKADAQMQETGQTLLQNGNRTSEISESQSRDGQQNGLGQKAITSAGESETAEGDHFSAAFRVAEVVWSGGVAILFLATLLSYYRLKKKLRAAHQVEERIYEMEGLPTPFVAGLRKPCIYLPVGLTGAEREYILAHENVHIKRFDYVFKMVGFFLVIVHWINPMVWTAYFCMTKDMEMSCDEAVLRNLGTGIKKDYSTSLLHMALPQSGARMTTLAFGEGNVKSRIKNVLHYKKMGAGILAGCICLVLVATIFLTTDRPESRDQMKVYKTSDEQPGNSVILQEHKFTDDVNSFMVYASFYTDGEETKRQMIASGAVTEENRQGEMELSLHYTTTEEETKQLSISVTEGAKSQFMTFSLPSCDIYAENVLWSGEKRVSYHNITPDTPYLIATEYIGNGTTEALNVYSCEDVMQDEDVKNMVLQQSKDAGIMTIMFYYVVSGDTEEQLTGSFESISQEPDETGNIAPEESLSESDVINRIINETGIENAVDYAMASASELEEGMVLLCTSESGKYEVYGVVSPEYGTHGILINDVIDGTDNWNYFYEDWTFGAEPPSITESEDGYEMELSLYQQKDKKEEIHFSSYDTGTVDTDDWQTD